MGYRSWVRVARCQLLVICLFIMVLSVGFACLTIITGLGSHFTTFTEASPADNPIRDLHSTMILYGSFICGLLLLTLLLSTMSVLRESQYLMATVDASVLDVYDDLYDQALTGYPGDTKEHLLHVHKIFQCCGKTLEQQKISTTHITCSNTDGKDCVSVISDVLRLHWFWVRTLLLSSLGLTVYGMVLSSFLYFSLPRGNMWERRGEYSLNGGLISPPNSTVDTPLIQLMPSRSAQ
ncbi:tetraspanin-32 isoform X2 [Bufo gargarizans]|uniref:tetraspanin-32 isoform X2 n=1 Tax=Bufo gargarizans TaxID=30331 RepID=UPI001CF4FDD0|nr:tetraspanin-32 isoform X2 [Bufo gargarizans]